MSGTIPEQRTIAEIIGWLYQPMGDYVVKRDGVEVERRPHGYWYPPGVTIIDPMGCWPNIDDMTTWIHSRGVEFSIQTWVPHPVTGPRDVAVSLYSGIDHPWPLIEEPTILAALESAVRTVAASQ